jgi:hypothetical protein
VAHVSLRTNATPSPTHLESKRRNKVTDVHSVNRLTEGEESRRKSILIDRVKLSDVSISFLVSWGGVRLSPLVTPAAVWPIVPAPDEGRW